jgi:hypothetical protein
MKDKREHKSIYDIDSNRVISAFHHILDQAFYDYKIFRLYPRSMGCYGSLDIPIPNENLILLSKVKQTKSYSKYSDSLIIRERRKRRVKVGDRTYYIKVGNYVTNKLSSTHDKFVELNEFTNGVECIYLCPILDNINSCEEMLKKIEFMIEYSKSKDMHDPIVIIKPTVKLKKHFQYYSFLADGGTTVFHSSIKIPKTYHALEYSNYLRKRFNKNHVKGDNIAKTIKEIFMTYYGNTSDIREYTMPENDKEVWYLLQEVGSRLERDWNVSCTLIGKYKKGADMPPSVIS